MPDSTGLSAETGQPLSDFAHVEQSVRFILTTRLRSIVMLREFGSDLPEYVDSKITQGNILRVYAACALAIMLWEKRFRVLRPRVVRVGPGYLHLDLIGLYFPRGLNDDFSIVEDASVRVLFGARA